MRDAAFRDLGLPELWSMTAVLNDPSQAVMRRIGMTESARFDHPRVAEASPLRPHVMFHLPNPAAPAAYRTRPFLRPPGRAAEPPRRQRAARRAPALA